MRLPPLIFLNCRCLNSTLIVRHAQAVWNFFSFYSKLAFSWAPGGPITVMVDPEKSDSNQGEQIIAGALWLPPRSRLAIWMVPTMIKAGVIPVLERWGLTGLLVRVPAIRMPSILTTQLRESFSNIKQFASHRCTSSLSEKGLKGRPMARGTSK